MPTYSFLDTNCAIVGPGGVVNMGAGAGAAEEGITIGGEDINGTIIGADGEGMHSLYANKSGPITARYLKTSPINKKLMQMYAFQTASSSSHGQNTISLSNSHTQDSITCQQVAFKKPPNLNYAKDGGIVEWEFFAIKIDRTLGEVT